MASFGVNLKIKTKLIISAVAFLLPLGIMLAIIISSSLAEIHKGRREIRGIQTLRPAVSILQVLPLYVRYAADNVDGNIDAIKRYSEEFLFDFIDKYNRNFYNEPILVSTNTLIEYWNHLAETKIRDTVLMSYKQYIYDLCKMITYIGEISGLVTDTDLELSYLVMTAIDELPQAQQRIVSIENLIRTISDGAFTLRRREELIREHMLLVYSDNTRIQNRVHSALALRERNTEVSETFENLLKTCYERIAVFSNAVEAIIENPVMDEKTLSMLSDAAGQTNNAAYNLQNASLSRMEILITSRISTYRQRLALSLFAAVIVTILAFSFITATVYSVYKTTNTMGFVFRRLDENDLSVKVEIHSQDELGEFMAALGSFLDKLKTAFRSFSRNAVMVSTAVHELSTSAVEISSTANQQSASVAQMVSTLEKNKNLATESALKTVEVAQLADLTQELSRRGANLRDANENMMLDIRNQNTKIISIIKNLADILSRIGESIQLIDTIADHTKLIAFNAALEAASSGEAGARFTVVAGEIRRFADNVAEYVSEIKEKIFELQIASNILISEADSGSKAITEGYNRMVEQKEVFDGIVNVSQQVASHSQQISSLSKQQEFASAQVFSALKEISSGIHQFVSATDMTTKAVEKLNKMSVELKETLIKYNTTNTEHV
jgi:methyl-accepting chemotaxis protein